MHGGAGTSVNIRFALPAEALRPYVTAYYRTDVLCAPRDPWVEDHLHPEWANLRIVDNRDPQGVIGAGPLAPCPRFAVTGPTSRAARFRIGTGRSWGIGLMPEGWARLFAASAADYADRIVDGLSDPLFAAFAPMCAALAPQGGDFASELAVIEEHMARAFAETAPPDPAIAAVTAALADPGLVAVADLAARVGMTVRSLERLSVRAFGFPPKLLLRRQRFLRSMARFMLDPSMTWLGAIGSDYHDQSHFVRDFRRFMGMNPSAYAKLDKPLLTASARARMAILGQAVQGLHAPHAAPVG